MSKWLALTALVSATTYLFFRCVVETIRAIREDANWRWKIRAAEENPWAYGGRAVVELVREMYYAQLWGEDWSQMIARRRAAAQRFNETLRRWRVAIDAFMVALQD